MSPGIEEEDDDYYVAVEEDTNQVSNEAEPFINTNIFSVTYLIMLNHHHP
jgi:hypothetical protein